MPCHALPLPLRRAAAERLLDELAELAVVVVHRELAVGIIEGALVQSDIATIDEIRERLAARLEGM